jgi:hypothetical protein
MDRLAQKTGSKQGGVENLRDPKLIDLTRICPSFRGSRAQSEASALTLVDET